jgi:dephospho-CoA kinase
MAVEIVGITGGIGAGKSIVSRILRLKGFRVYDCDYEAKRLMNSDKDFKQSLVDKFGNDILIESNNEILTESANDILTESTIINKKRMADLIFNNIDARNYVNKSVRSLIHSDIQKQKGECRHPGETLFIESAILYSSELYKICDSIILVDADTDVRIIRVKGRNSLPEEEIRQRMASQQLEYDYIRGCGNTIIIDNNPNSKIIPQIYSYLEKYNNLSCRQSKENGRS